MKGEMLTLVMGLTAGAGLMFIATLKPTPVEALPDFMPKVVIPPTEDYINAQGQQCLVWWMPKDIYYYQCEGGDQGIYQVVSPEIPWRLTIPAQSDSLKQKLLAAQ